MRIAAGPAPSGDVAREETDMALRTYMDPDGQAWHAWQVHPGNTGAGYAARFREGWVCFERVDGGGRCRIPIDQMPPGWDSLPEQRLDLLRRVAEAASATTTATRLPDSIRKAAEDAARLKRSGPTEIIGRDHKDD